MIGEPFQSAILEGLPPMAVPMTVKMPEPMTAPMPRAVRETGPRVFLRACSGRSESAISLSIDLVRKNCLARAVAPEEWVRGNRVRISGTDCQEYYMTAATLRKECATWPRVI